MKRLYKWLDKLVQKCFYGCVTIKFANGKIVSIKKEESLNVEDIT
jgi:hypothetical protein